MSDSVACAVAPAFSCNGSIDWLGSIRARAGVVLDNLLLFATAGLSVGGATGTVTPTFPGTTSTFSDIHVGWTAGAGAEFAINDVMSLKAEYSFSNLGSRTAPVGTLGPAQTYTASPIVHAAKVGVNFHL